MERLNESISEILEAIKDYRSLYSSNEQAVRAQLIEPVLNALGWKTSNPKFVRPNAPNEEGKIPDYTLFKEGKSILVVEAKNISIELNDNKVINQIANYCYKPGIDFGILTNGIKWLLFKTFEKNPQDRIIWEIDLESESLDNVIRKLTSFSFENIDTLEKIIHNSKVLELTWNQFIPSPNKIVTIVFDEFLKRIRTSNPGIKIEMNEIKSFTENKLSDYFELDLSDNINGGNYSDSSKNLEFAEVNESLFEGNKKKREREKISVLFPDKTIFNEQKPTDTFVKVINKIGPEQIEALGIFHCGVPLISTAKDKKYYQHKEGRFYFMTQASTQKKYDMLNEINQRLKLNLKIEKFIP